MTNQNKAYLYAGITVFLWSTVASAFKLSLRYLDPLQLLCYANAVSICILFATLAIQGKVRLIFTTPPRRLTYYLVLGLLNPFLYYLVLLKAYDLLPAQEAQPLNYTWAITLIILSVPLLKQKIDGREFGAIMVSYLGVLIISTHGNLLELQFSNKLGVLLALFSTVIWALYWIYNTRDKNDPVAGLFFSFLFGFPFVLITTYLFSELWAGFSPGLWGALYVGTFEMGIAFILWLRALKLSATTAKVGNLIFFAPFLSLVFIHLLVGERILASTLVGLVFIVAGNVLQKWFSRRRTATT